MGEVPCTCGAAECSEDTGADPIGSYGARTPLLRVQGYLADKKHPHS